MMQNDQQYKIWYKKPAAELWTRTLHLGNGIMGASVFGGIQTEKIIINYTHLWRHAKTLGRVNEDCTKILKVVRNLIFQGRLREANLMAYRGLGTQWNLDVHENWFGPDPYVPAGQIDLIFPEVQNCIGYRNELDMLGGTAVTSYVADGVSVKRTFFTDMNSLLTSGELKSDCGRLNVQIGLSRVADDECDLCFEVKNNIILLKGTFFEGVTYVFGLKVIANEGKSELVDIEGMPRFRITDADSAEVYSFVEIQRENLDPDEVVLSKLSEAGSISFKELLVEHQKTFSSYMSRLQLDIKAPENWPVIDMNKPTDERVADFLNGTDDPGINITYYQYGRYILLCSSINGGKPFNLTGIWGDQLKPDFNSDFHHDINSEAPYWIAETTNLPETTDALINYVESLIPAGKEAAKKIYGCRGVFIPLSTGGYPECLKLEASWDEWIGAAAWLGQHFYQHYQFTGDVEYLREHAYPYLKEVAQFYSDYLVEDPREEHRYYKKLQVVPSYSPENAFMEAGPAPVSLSVSCAMDIELVMETMTNVIEASEILGEDEEQRREWRNILDKLAPLQIGSRGQLMEWQEEYTEDFVTTSSEGFRHRHASHLYAMFPGDMITERKTPELFEAAKVALAERVMQGEGRRNNQKMGGGDMFPILYAALYARAKMPNEAYHHIRLNEKQSYPATNCPREGLRPGTAATMTEMMMQSHDGAIELLPALPPVYDSGMVKGLVARGGYIIDISWKNGILAEAVITAQNSGTVKVRYKDSEQEISLRKGQSETVNFKGGRT